MKQATIFFRTVMLIILALVVTIGLFFVSLLSFVLYSAGQTQSWNAPIRSISDALSCDASNHYTFTGQELLQQQDLWAMLIDPDGVVVWSEDKPPEVPTTYSRNDIASFTRWYLCDYPVQCQVRDDGLLVVGAPQNTTWKYTFESSLASLKVLFWGGPLFFLLSISMVVWLCSRLLRRWFRAEQKQRDQARADWVSGVSHDIRTPLSMVMGYASELEQDPSLSAAQRSKASILVRQSQRIKELVNDLNLTMRLDYAMQPLRKTTLYPAALVRQVAAEVLNSGLDPRFSLSVDIMSSPMPPLEADRFLLCRALYNLVGNCIQHNPDGCAITLGVKLQEKTYVLWVANNAPHSTGAAPQPNAYGIEADGGAAHGTGLKLVGQIARAHCGRAIFHVTEAAYCCEIHLPIKRH